MSGVLGGKRGRELGSRVPGQVPARLIEFFAANPAEELTYDDAVAKFGVSRKTVHDAVYRLKSAGEVETACVIRRAASKGREA